jgi:hypothetical protein
MSEVLCRVSVIFDRIDEKLFGLARFTIAQALTHRREDVIEFFGRYISFAARPSARERS